VSVVRSSRIHLCWSTSTYLGLSAMHSHRNTSACIAAPSSSRLRCSQIVALPYGRNTKISEDGPSGIEWIIMASQPVVLENTW
jgi:hypothetical protein